MAVSIEDFLSGKKGIADVRGQKLIHVKDSSKEALKKTEKAKAKIKRDITPINRNNRDNARSSPIISIRPKAEKKNDHKKQIKPKSTFLTDAFDKEETWLDKLKKGNVGGATANFIGSGLTGAQSMLSNASNNIVSLASGKGIQEFKYNMSNDDFQKEIAKRHGGKTINQKAHDINPILGGVVELLGEVVTDPLELTPFGSANDIKALKTGVKSASYADNLKQGKMLPKIPIEPKKKNVPKSETVESFSKVELQKSRVDTPSVKNTIEKPTIKPKERVKKQLEDLADKNNFMSEINKTMRNEMPSSKPLTVTHTPEILKQYGAKNDKITMKQSTVRKIAYPSGYLGQQYGHNLGFKALESLGDSLRNPIAILDSFTHDNSRIIVTNMLDGEGKPVIAALHIDKDGIIGISDEIASMYGRNGFEEFIERARKEGKVLYEAIEKGADTLSLNGLQLSEMKALSDPIFSISNTGKKSTYNVKKSSFPNADTGHSPAAAEKGLGLNNNISNPNAKVNRDLGADINEVEGVNFGNEYGTMPNKNTSIRYANVPSKTPFGDVSQGARSIVESGVVDDDTAKRIKSEIESFTKYTKTNKTSLDNAIARVESDTDKAYNDFKSILSNNQQASSESISLGYKLAEKLQANGEMDKVIDVLADVSNMSSEMGRGLQSMRIFNNLTPLGRQKSIINTAKKISAETGKNIKINDELLKGLGEATTELDIAAIKKKISLDMWNQVPANFWEKANAFRYMAMLGNPKTHIRNILGNAIFVPVMGMKNIIATGLEKALIRGSKEKTKALLTVGDGKLIKAGASDFDIVKETLKGNSKYIESSRDLDARIFGKNPMGSALEGIRKFNGWALDYEDGFFMKMAYKRNYAQYLKSNGVKDIAKVTEELAQKARQYAGQESLKATYRDANVLAEFLNKAKINSGKKLSQVNGRNVAEKMLHKGIGLGIEATVPFTKTPLNILKRGLEYSPVGVVKGVGEFVSDLKNGESLVKAIDDLSAGLTGSAIAGIGAYLYSQGLITSNVDTMTKDGAYDSMLGKQAYSVKMDIGYGDDYEVSVDWITPSSMALFTGVEMAKFYDGKETRPIDILLSLSNVSDPLFNLSMLSGLNNAFNTAFADDDNKTRVILGNMAEGYLSQYFPTILAQVARTMAGERRISVSTDQNTKVREVEKIVDKLENKLPWLTDKNEPYVDLWGRTETKENDSDYINSALQNFLSPAYIKKQNITEVDRELNYLREEVDEDTGKEILPSKQTTYVYKLGDKEYRMTKSELTQFKKTKGQVAYEGLERLFNSSKYATMTGADKVKAIKGIYKDAGQAAQDEMLLGKDVKQYEIDFQKLSPERRKKYDNTVSKEEYAYYFGNASTDGNSGIKQDEARAILSDMDLSPLQRAYLWNMTNSRWKTGY